MMFIVGFMLERRTSSMERVVRWMRSSKARRGSGLYELPNEEYWRAMQVRAEAECGHPWVQDDFDSFLEYQRQMEDQCIIFGSAETTYFTYDCEDRTEW